MEVSSNRAIESSREGVLRGVVCDVHRAFPSLHGLPFFFTGTIEGVADHFLVDVFDQGKCVARDHIAHRDEIFFTPDELLLMTQHELSLKRLRGLAVVR